MFSESLSDVIMTQKKVKRHRGNNYLTFYLAQNIVFQAIIFL